MTQSSLLPNQLLEMRPVRRNRSRLAACLKTLLDAAFLVVLAEAEQQDAEVVGGAGFVLDPGEHAGPAGRVFVGNVFVDLALAGDHGAAGLDVVFQAVAGEVDGAGELGLDALKKVAGVGVFGAKAARGSGRGDLAQALDNGFDQQFALLLGDVRVLHHVFVEVFQRFEGFLFANAVEGVLNQGRDFSR